MSTFLLLMRRFGAVFVRQSSTIAECPVHNDLLKILVCPLTKAPLRYDAVNNELVCDEMGVAYPVLQGGVPNLYPQDGRVLNNTEEKTN